MLLPLNKRCFNKWCYRFFSYRWKVAFDLCITRSWRLMALFHSTQNWFYLRAHTHTYIMNKMGFMAIFSLWKLILISTPQRPSSQLISLRSGALQLRNWNLIAWNCIINVLRDSLTKNATYRNQFWLRTLFT